MCVYIYVMCYKSVYIMLYSIYVIYVICVYMLYMCIYMLYGIYIYTHI